MKQWKRLAALSSAIVMAAATLTYFPNDTLQNIRLEISASAGTTTEPQVWNEDNLTWTLYADGKLTISGTGAMKDYNAADNLSPAYMNSDVKKVVIEDGVTSIGELAFFKCSSLTNITIPDSVTCIAYAAFHGCSSLSSITIPNSVTSIGIYAFVVCSSLTSITIPDGVTSIGYGAFSNCSSLKTISLSCKSSLKKSDFGEQADLVSYTNQHALTKTAAKDATCAESGNKEYWTCKHCGKYFLSDDANPETAKAVEQSETVIPALNHKNATTRGAFEPTETEPGYSGDRYCPDCDTVFEKGYTYWNEGNLTWKLDADGTLTISGTGAMKNYDYNDNPSPVYNNSNVKKVVIEDGVTSIGNSAFNECISLTSITIPDSVTSIGTYAFSGCRSLTSITIPDSVTSIGAYAFQSCSNLTSITIPDSVTSIGASAFNSCSGLTSITIPDSVTSIGNFAFSYCISLTSITIPDSVTSIGSYAFYNCKNLTTISLSCKSSLKKSDFGDKADLVSYTNQHLLTKTAAKAATCSESGNKEYWTCEHCGKYFLSDDSNPETAKAVELSETVISASHKLTKVEAKDATCTEDGNKEYWTCEHCGKYFLSDDTNPETAKAVELSETILPAIQHKNAELRNSSEPTETAPGYSGDLYCPDCDKVVEKGYTYWNEGNLTWKLYEDGTLNISGTGAMKDYNDDDNPSPVYQNSNVKKVVIEKGVTSIGNYAFSGCLGLKSITIPDGITSIGDHAFDSCINLRSITLPDSITSIGMWAFYNCWNVSSIIIPDGVTSIEDFTFNSCISLTSITIPNSVTNIKSSAFHNCADLTSITIPDSVTSIGYAAFSNCDSLQTISLGCGSALKKSDFGDQANLVSYTNQHLLTKTEAKAKTCTEDGNKEYWTCEHCGKYFLSDDTNPETAKAVEQSEFIIPASHKLTKVEAKAPTCTEDGNKEYWTCEHCGKYFLSDDTNPKTAKAVEQAETVIPALKHKNATTRGAVEPNGTKPGYSGDRYCPDCDTVFEKGYTYWNEDNLTWKLYADGKLTISGTGAMKDYNIENNKSPVFKNSNVKKVVIEDGVTSIGAYAFYSCDNSISITIPSSVTSIGDSAFAACGLTSITIPSSVTSIGDFAFNSCGSLTSITIPDSVTSIGSYAFTSCSSLTSITIPDSVTSIGDWTFNNCSSLTSITIPDSVTSIGDSAFAYCERLTSITIPDRVTSIEPYAFRDCESLTSITIPDGVTSIGNYAFYNCSSLTSIMIPDSVTSIGNSAFDNCSSLKTISLSCGSVLKKSNFGDQADLVSYTNQHILTKTEAKDATCTESGNKEYWTCEHCGKYFLSDDTNPETAKAVEQSETILPAIQHKNAELRNSSEPTETAPGYSGDLYCPDCDKVVEKGYTYWIEDNLTWKLYEDGTLNISGTGAMKDYNSTDNLSPAYMNSSVKKVVIEEGVTNIGNWAFSECSSLTSITIPDSVTNIGAAAFDSCGSLTSITIPGSVTSIGTVAFYNCSGLTSVTIPDSVTNIGAAAFDSCGSLTSIVIPNSVTSIEPYAFSACSSLTSITIPDSVTSIGNNAFDSCSSLTSITIPDSVTSIGNNAFDSCSSLTSITIPDGVTSIESYAFYNCSGLTSITIPDSVTNIGAAAFDSCTSLTSITIPDSVTSIESYAFCNCSNLTSITIPDSVTNIGAAAFDSCTSLKTISLSCKSSLKRSDFGEQVNSVSYASHTLKKTEAKAATYAENGNKAYWTCEHCGKYFLSDDSNPETAKAVELSETVIPALVQVATTTTPIKCVYGQDMNKIDLRDYVKNTDVVGEVTVKVATDSTLPDGMKLDGSKLSGKPAKAYEDGKEVTFTFTAENGNTANLTLLFLVAKADPTVEVAVSGDSHTEGDLVGELELILSENSTKGVVELVSEIKALVAGKNTLTWKFTPEDENNYNMVTGTVVVNAQTTTTTTTTKATTTTTKATTTTKPSKTTTTKATTTTKPSKTTTTKVTTTTKPSKTTTTKVTTTTKPSKTTTTKATTTTKPNKTTTTKTTTTTKPNKTTTTKVTTTTKPSKTTTTNATTTNTAIPSYGDVNLDGKVDIVDAIFLNKYLATLIQFSDAQMANADCCQDGVLNDQDTTALMQFIILLIDDLPVQPTEK